MADEKLTALTALDAFATGDLLYTVDNPGGTPLSKKATIDQAKSFIVGAGSVSIASGKTLTGSNTLTLAGTDATTMTFPATSGTVATLNTAQTFTALQTINGSGEQLALGSAGANSGVMSFAGSTSGKVTVQAAAAAGTYTLTLPVNDGDSGQFLQTNGSGVTSWAAASGSGSPGGSDTQIQYNNAGSFGGASGLTTNGTSLTITGIANPLVPSLSVNAGSNITGTAITGVQITGTAGQFSCTAASLSVGQLLTISGTLGGTGSITGYANPTTYRISVTDGSTTFTLVNNTTGAALTTTAGTPTGLTYTLTSPGVNVSQTWNNSAVAFTGLRYNATDTASNAASLLMDLQVGTVSQFSVRKNGQASITTTEGSGVGLVITGPANVAGTISSNSPSRAGSISLGSDIGSALGITSALAFGSSIGFRNISTGVVSWSSGNLNAANGQADTLLTRRAVANLRLGAADAGSNTATVTITIATPGVVTWNSHGLSTGTPVFFTTSGALPTGITASTTYYVIFVDTSTIQIATSLANALSGTAVNTSGTQSGTQTGNRNAITQALSVQSVTGVTDRPGADMLITGSQGTGTGAGGSIVFRVAPAGSSGSAQNALATQFQVNGSGGVTGQDGATANTLALRNGAAAQTFNVYNTFTSATNFERFRIFAQSAAAVLIGTEKGSGGGTARALELQTDATSRLALDTVGSARIVTALTVATLPGTPLTGMMARVTDALAPAVGVTVAAGGAAQALCWYNGANWTVIGV